MHFQQRAFVAHAMQNTSEKLPSAEAAVHVDSSPLCVQGAALTAGRDAPNGSHLSSCSLLLLTALMFYYSDFSLAVLQQVKLTVAPQKAKAGAATQGSALANRSLFKKRRKKQPR